MPNDPMLHTERVLCPSVHSTPLAHAVGSSAQWFAAIAVGRGQGNYVASEVVTAAAMVAERVEAMVVALDAARGEGTVGETLQEGMPWLMLMLMLMLMLLLMLMLVLMMMLVLMLILLLVLMLMPAQVAKAALKDGVQAALTHSQPAPRPACQSIIHVRQQTL